ncbi:MAG TPA: cobalt ECF transporter T component CbiQ [Desulfitobacteriaceae bacterium]|nr:cobalt ECF transporter T component CbiQ [Desulfitobacteriaceae bacterium]
MINIDFYAYSNKLNAVHPLEKVLFAVITMLICLLSGSIFTPILILVLMAVAIVLMAGIPAHLYGRLLLLPLTFLLLSVLSIAFSAAASTVGFWISYRFGNLVVGIRFPDLIKAMHLFLRSLGSVSCLYFLALTTPMTEVINLLRKLKIPVLITELMILIYRFIFVFLESAATIKRAQSSRLGYINIRSSFRSLSQLVVALFGKVFIKSRELFETMSARCYGGEINVLAKNHLVNYTNYVLIGVCAFLIISLDIVWR